MKPIKLVALATSCLALLLLLASGTYAGDDASEAPPSDLDVITARIAADVERVRGRPFETTPKAVFIDPMQMMMGGGPGGPGPMAGPGGPGGGGSPLDMMKMMGRAVVGCAALGLVPEDAAARWIGADGQLASPNPWELFGGPGAGGPGGMPGMPGMPPVPGLSGKPEIGAPGGIMGAFYRDDAGIVTVMKRGGDPDRALLEQILAHELTHALDDQHHDITRFTPGGTFEGDGQLAVQALVEGSAVYSELDWTTRAESEGRITSVLENESLPRYGGYLKADGMPAPREKKGLVRRQGGSPMQSLPGLKETPKMFAKRGVFPYAYGFEFVKHLRTNGVTVDQAYEDLPTSSEQIMHPERYLAEVRDEPTDVRVKDLEALLSAGGAVSVDERTLGEFLTRCVLEEHEIENAAEAAAGWDGDRIVVATVEKRVAFLWVSTWDSEADAAEFAQALGVVLEKRYPDTSLLLQDGCNVIATRGLGETIAAAIRQEGVAGVLAPLPKAETTTDSGIEETER